MKVNYSNGLVVVAIVLCLPIAGCNQGPPYGDITGQVTLDDQPVETGSIRLIPIDGNTASGGAAIEHGHYTATHVPVNKFRVEINAGKGPAMPPGADPLKYQGVMGVEIIPAQYNTQSKLTLDVKEGSNQHDFTLAGK
jgi:hypothetical protein